VIGLGDKAWLCDLLSVCKGDEKGSERLNLLKNRVEKRNVPMRLNTAASLKG
jgi:hypothetical protein